MAEKSFGNSVTWKVGAGVAVGFAAVATGLLLSRSGRRLVKEVWQGRTRTRLEDRILDRIWSDRTLSRRPIDVREVGPGTVELIGSVRTDEEGHHAVSIAQSVEGVGSVVNRLRTEAVETRLADNRRRYKDGDPALHETRWYGGGVGIGRRRQSPQTDPDRRDDKVDMVTRELGVARAEREASEPIEKTPPAVDGHSTGQAITEQGRVRPEAPEGSA